MSSSRETKTQDARLFSFFFFPLYYTRFVIRAHFLCFVCLYYKVRFLGLLLSLGLHDEDILSY